jgi:hypothetical protein
MQAVYLFKVIKPMNFYVKPIKPIPVETIQAFRKMNDLLPIYAWVGDHLDEMTLKITPQVLNPFKTADMEMTLCLSMVTLFQYVESLPDMMAADAMIRRIDWKYALHLPFYHQGFSPDLLCGFRQHLFSSHLALAEYQLLLDGIDQTGLTVGSIGKPLLAAAVLTRICQISRFHQLSVAMKSALSFLVSTAPEWLRAHMPPYWYERYRTGRLASPYSENDQYLVEEATKLGADMQFLLSALGQHDPLRLANYSEIRSIARLFETQFTISDQTIYWRQSECEHCVHSEMRVSYH